MGKKIRLSAEAGVFGLVSAKGYATQTVVTGPEISFPEYRPTTTNSATTTVSKPVAMKKAIEALDYNER